MVRTEIQLFLANVPGELGKLSALLAEHDINIDAMTIQDASAYVNELFKARGKSLKRIAPAASYNSMQKDSADYALIRVLVNQVETCMDLLTRNGYLFDITPVIALTLQNQPGSLAALARKFGEAGININYIYGSALSGDPQGLFVISPADMTEAVKLFDEGM
ncbi:MAG: amino acid-binding protein [Desulfobacteraceae bacterium]|nr:MAG: amino acid-binding protein [Desulfobacteraceae bacterium]